ncbi:hypothetical protein QL285_088622 [Trifolium repens]|nr:hypothetical protein QL285_088622 [Trifolium repens]
MFRVSSFKLSILPRLNKSPGSAYANRYTSILHSHSIFRFHSHSQSLFRCFGTVYDMAVDLTSETVVTVGQADEGITLYVLEG